MKPTSPQPPASFEAALHELEGIVQTLEGGGTPLEESLQAYERGVGLLAYCQSTLSRAEQKIRVLDSAGLREFAPPSADTDAPH